MTDRALVFLLAMGATAIASTGAQVVHPPDTGATFGAIDFADFSAAMIGVMNDEEYIGAYRDLIESIVGPLFAEGFHAMLETLYTDMGWEANGLPDAIENFDPTTDDRDDVYVHGHEHDGEHHNNDDESWEDFLSLDEGGLHDHVHPHGGGLGDPHFVVFPQGSDSPICFDYDPPAGTNVLLVSDSDMSLKVSAHMYRPEKAQEKISKDKVFMNVITVEMPGCTIRADFEHVTATSTDGRTQAVEWGMPKAKLTCGDDYTLQYVQGGAARKFYLTNNRDFSITLIRQYSKSDYYSLAFDMSEQDGLGYNLDGLLGQFMNKGVQIIGDVNDIGSLGMMHFADDFNHLDRHEIDVQANKRFDMSTMEMIPCWFAPVASLTSETDYII